MGVKADLDELAAFNERNPDRPVLSTQLSVRTKSLRRALGLKAKDPLEYRGIKLRCVGSQKWRTVNQYAAKPEAP